MIGNSLGLGFRIDKKFEIFKNTRNINTILYENKLYEYKVMLSVNCSCMLSYK